MTDREELSRHKLGLIEEEEKKAKEGIEEDAAGGGGEKKVNGTLDPEVGVSAGYPDFWQKTINGNSQVGFVPDIRIFGKKKRSTAPSTRR